MPITPTNSPPSSHPQNRTPLSISCRRYLLRHIGDLPTVGGNDAAIGFGRVVDDGEDRVEVGVGAGADHDFRSVILLQKYQHESIMDRFLLENPVAQAFIEPNERSRFCGL